ncbi:hypothetical protein [Pseudomonas aeruginosa]|uniref:hypothetical protein n=1 Tax=Pseudomonas aeruginosa TaxID=287 RepID=UPI00048640EE|nr:hypothetical protein [Pseudomonas aeruginosa]
MPEDAFLPAIGPNEVDVLADKLAHWRAQQAGMLSDQVNVQALVPVRLEARDFLRRALEPSLPNTRCASSITITEPSGRLYHASGVSNSTHFDLSRSSFISGMP